VSVDPESETVSVSGTGTGTGTGTGSVSGAGTGSVTGTGTGPGEVKPKPAEAEQVNVTLREWAVVPDVTTVKAGQVYFLADNQGPNDPHELVVIRTDLEPGQLPVVEGRVSEDQVDFIGEIEAFAPGTQAADTFELTPGNYALICNIAEMEGGELESHYQQGMYTRLVVEESTTSSSDSSSDDIYTPVSNVDGYFNFSLDLRDIKDLIDAGDWEGTAAIYENGKNFVRDDGTLRSLQSLAVSEEVLAIFPNGAQVYGNQQFLDTHIQAGLDGSGRGEGLSDEARGQLVDKGIQAVLYAKALQEIESARTRTAEGNTDNESGAPHAVDEAAAIYLGAKNEEGERAYSLSNTARSREGNFGLEGKLDEPLQMELVTLQRAAQAGDLAAFEAAEARVRGYLNTIFYLAMLRYAGSTLDAAVTDRPVPMAEGWAFYQTLRATVAQASPETADRINELFSGAPESVPDTMVTEVYDGLNSPAVLEALGVPAELQVTQ
jgi:uncharacterized cupredoxin-like copper-binding protein